MTMSTVNVIVIAAVATGVILLAAIATYLWYKRNNKKKGADLKPWVRKAGASLKHNHISIVDIQRHSDPVDSWQKDGTSYEKAKANGALPHNGKGPTPEGPALVYIPPNQRVMSTMSYDRPYSDVLGRNQSVDVVDATEANEAVQMRVDRSRLATPGEGNVLTNYGTVRIMNTRHLIDSIDAEMAETQMGSSNFNSRTQLLPEDQEGSTVIITRPISQHLPPSTGSPTRIRHDDAVYAVINRENSYLKARTIDDGKTTGTKYAPYSNTGQQRRVANLGNRLSPNFVERPYEPVWQGPVSSNRVSGPKYTPQSNRMSTESPYATVGPDPYSNREPAPKFASHSNPVSANLSESPYSKVRPDSFGNRGSGAITVPHSNQRPDSNPTLPSNRVPGINYVSPSNRIGASRAQVIDPRNRVSNESPYSIVRSNPLNTANYWTSAPSLPTTVGNAGQQQRAAFQANDTLIVRRQRLGPERVMRYSRLNRESSPSMDLGTSAGLNPFVSARINLQQDPYASFRKSKEGRKVDSFRQSNGVDLGAEPRKAWMASGYGSNMEMYPCAGFQL